MAPGYLGLDLQALSMRPTHSSYQPQQVPPLFCARAHPSHRQAPNETMSNRCPVSWSSGLGRRHRSRSKPPREAPRGVATARRRHHTLPRPSRQAVGAARSVKRATTKSSSSFHENRGRVFSLDIFIAVFPVRPGTTSRARCRSHMSP